MEEHMKILLIILSFGLFTFSSVAEWKTHPNGRKEKRHADGTFEIRYPNGRVSIVHPDRRVTLRDPDGTQTIVHPDGTQTKGTWDKKDSIFYKPPKPIIKPTEKKKTVFGLSSYRRATGGVIRFPRKGNVSQSSKGKSDGGVVTKHSDGSVVTKYSDGMVVTTNANKWPYYGRIDTKYPDGRVKVLNPKTGSYEINYPNGKKVLFSSDDGRTKTIYPDGSYAIEHPDGRNETFDKKGRLVEVGMIQVDPGPGVSGVSPGKSSLAMERDKWKKEASLYKNDYLKCKRNLASYSASKPMPIARPVSLGRWSTITPPPVRTGGGYAEGPAGIGGDDETGGDDTGPDKVGGAIQ